MKVNDQETMEQLTNVECCWVPVKVFASQVRWPSESAMRSYIFKAKELGLDSAFLRVGRRVLVNPKRFFNLISNINTNIEGQNER